MFLRLETGYLMNLTSIEGIGFFHDVDEGKSEVRAQPPSGGDPIVLFSSDDPMKASLYVKALTAKLNKAGVVVIENDSLVTDD